MTYLPADLPGPGRPRLANPRTTALTLAVTAEVKAAWSRLTTTEQRAVRAQFEKALAGAADATFLPPSSTDEAARLAAAVGAIRDKVRRGVDLPDRVVWCVDGLVHLLAQPRMSRDGLRLALADLAQALVDTWPVMGD